MTRTGQTIYIEIVAEKITVVKVSGKTSAEIALKKAAFRVVDLIIDRIYYHHSLNKRSTVYIENLDTS